MNATRFPFGLSLTRYQAGQPDLTRIVYEESIVSMSRFISAIIIAASVVALVKADPDPGMDEALESTDQTGWRYYKLETEWVQDKKANCAHDAAVVERILNYRDRGGSLGEVLLANKGEKYYIKIAVSHWNDEDTARDTAKRLYRYCIDKGTYWSPLSPVDRKTG